MSNIIYFPERPEPPKSNLDDPDAKIYTLYTTLDDETPGVQEGDDDDPDPLPVDFQGMQARVERQAREDRQRRIASGILRWEQYAEEKAREDRQRRIASGILRWEQYAEEKAREKSTYLEENP